MTLHESDTVEYKNSLPLTEPAFKSVCGFLEASQRRHLVRQRRAFEYLKNHPVILTQEYGTMYECTIRTARRDLSRLIQLGVVTPTRKGKQWEYSLHESSRTITDNHGQSRTFDERYNNWRKQEILDWQAPASVYHNEMNFNKNRKYLPRGQKYCQQNGQK